MITFEEMRAKYPPRKVENQREFDTVMNQMREAQNGLMRPLRDTSEQLNERRHEIGRQLAELNMELSSINRQRETLREEYRNLGTIFYGLKKEMIRMNPKSVPPTCAEANAETATC